MGGPERMTAFDPKRTFGPRDGGRPSGGRTTICSATRWSIRSKVKRHTRLVGLPILSSRRASIRRANPNTQVCGQRLSQAFASGEVSSVGPYKKTPLAITNRALCNRFGGILSGCRVLRDFRECFNTSLNGRKCVFHCAHVQFIQKFHLADIRAESHPGKA